MRSEILEAIEKWHETEEYKNCESILKDTVKTICRRKEMTNDKYPIGSQWKTRAGHRAVVVKRYDDQEGYDGCFKTWEENLGLCFHFKDGKSNFELNREHDLIAPWTEPRKGAFWVNIYDDKELAVRYKTKEYADNNRRAGRLACVKVNWIEGQGLESK